MVVSIAKYLAFGSKENNQSAAKDYWRTKTTRNNTVKGTDHNTLPFFVLVSITKAVFQNDVYPPYRSLLQ